MRWLIWGNLLMASSAAGWTIITLHLLHLPTDYVLIALSFSLALTFYLRDRLDVTEQASDQHALPERTTWLQANSTQLHTLFYATIALTIGLIIVRPQVIYPLLFGVGFALTYTVRWLPWQGQRYGWKHLPACKMPFVAWLWVLTTVLTPAAVYQRLPQADTWLLAGAIFCFIMIQILLNDLRDMKADRVSNTLSLPVLVGPHWAKRIGYMIVGLALLSISPIAIFSFLPIVLFNLYLLWVYQVHSDRKWRPFIEAQCFIAALIVLTLNR